VAFVAPHSEVARIVTRSNAGWVVPNTEPARLASVLSAILEKSEELARRGAAALGHARAHFTPGRSAERFEVALDEALQGGVPSALQAGDGRRG